MQKHTSESAGASGNGHASSGKLVHLQNGPTALTQNQPPVTDSMPYPLAVANDSADARQFTYDPTVADTIPLKDTPLSEAIKVISRSAPAQASRLYHIYDHKRGHAAKTFKDLVANNTETLKQRLEDAANYNEQLTKRQNAIHKTIEERTRYLQAALADVQQLLHQNLLAAADDCGEAYGLLDLDNPATASLAPPKADDLESIADDLRLPWTGSSYAPYCRAVWIAITCAMGTALSLGILLAAGIVNADALARQWPILALALPVCIALAAANERGIWMSFHRVGGYRWRSARDYAMALVVAVATLVLLCAIDATVECSGLLARTRLQDSLQSSLSGQPASTPAFSGAFLLFIIIGLVVFAGFAIAVASEGYSAGRFDEVSAQVRGEQARRLKKERGRWSADPDVRAANARLGKIGVLRKKRSAIVAEIELISKPYISQIEALESVKLPEGMAIVTQDNLQIRGAYNNVLGAQAEFDAELKRAVNSIEEASSDESRRAKT